MTSESFSAGVTDTARNNGFVEKLSETASIEDYRCMEQDESRPSAKFTQDELYLQAAEAFGAALERLTRAYEVDSEKRCDLLQEIHMAGWRSFESYASLCSLRTWVYRVAHNTPTSYVLRQRRRRKEIFVNLDEVEMLSDPCEPETAADQRKTLERLLGLIQRLEPLDRQVMLSYAALTIAGSLYVCYQLQKRGSARKLPAEPGLKTCLEFHRTELVQQRNLLRDVWRWYLLPFVPGFSLFFASQVMQAPWTRWGIFLVWFVILFAGIGMLNRWAARRLQREIEALEKES